MQTARDRTNRFADQEGYAYRRFQFACIRSGNSQLIKQLLTSESYQKKQLEIFDGDTSTAMQALNFVAPQGWDVAVQSGVPEKEADKHYDQFLNNLRRSGNVIQMIRAYNRFMISLAETVKRRNAPRKSSPRVQNAKNYIAQHIGEKLTVDQIADYLKITPSYLSHTFKIETGQTLTAYILEERIQLAKLLLLQPEASVAGVMEQLGFISQSHFTKAFRDNTGLTPGKYQVAASKGEMDMPKEFLDQDTSKRIQSTWYIRAEEYGQRKGLEQQRALMNAIRKGDASAVRAYLDSSHYQEDMQLLFRRNLVCAQETFICLWPQAVHAAVEGGLKKSSSADMQRQFMPRLYRCQTVQEVMDLNREFLILLTQKVQKLG